MLKQTCLLRLSSQLISIFLLSLVCSFSVFAEGPSACPGQYIGEGTCARAERQVNNNPGERARGLFQRGGTTQAVQALGGQVSNAARVTGNQQNIGLSAFSSDPYRFQLLSQLMGMIGGIGGNIASMFQGLAASAVSGILQDPGQYSNYYQQIMAPIIGQIGWNMSTNPMGNFGNMGNANGISGQMFGQYNVGSGGNSNFGNLGGIAGLVGIGQNSGQGQGILGSIFGMFGGGNLQNGNWLGTVLTVAGMATGNSNLIMAGQVVNTLSNMNQGQQGGFQQGGIQQGLQAIGGGVNGGSVTPIAPGSNHDQQVGQMIVNSEGQRGSDNIIDMYTLPSSDNGGTHEFAGINSRYHPEALAQIQTLKNQGRDAEAEQYAASYIANYTNQHKPSNTQFANDPGVDYFVRDTTFNRGGSGASWIVREANNMPAANAQQYINNLRITRERYENEVIGTRSSLSAGLTNRWNSAQQTARGLSQGSYS